MMVSPSKPSHCQLRYRLKSLRVEVQISCRCKITYLMVMDPPGAGHDPGVPGGAVTHRHRPRLVQCLRRNRLPCKHNQRLNQNVFFFFFWAQSDEVGGGDSLVGGGVSQWVGLCVGGAANGGCLCVGGSQ